jgi:hypothetical protein
MTSSTKAATILRQGDEKAAIKNPPQLRPV